MPRGHRNPDKENFWRNVLEKQRRSGLSIRAFCARQGLSEPSFHAWRRTLAERDRQSASVASKPTPAFVPVRIALPTTESTIELVVGVGRVIRVSSGFDADTLRNLIAVLEAPSC